MADDCRGRAGVHRLRGRQDNLLEFAGRLSRRTITRQAAVAQIATSYREWVDLFEKAR